MSTGDPRKVDEALADWRHAERELDAAVDERRAAEEKALTLERIEDSVARSAADAEVTAQAAEQARRSASEAMSAVAEVSESAKEDLARAVTAEESAQDAHEAARSEHRAAQDEAVRRYRSAGWTPPADPSAPEPDRQTSPDEIPESGSAV